MKAGAFVILHCSNPTEKYWGRLETLRGEGVTLRGVGLESFDDWVRDVARDERDGLGLVTLFVPLFRVERMFRDERVGGAPSYCELFASRVGRSVQGEFQSDPETGQDATSAGPGLPDGPEPS